MEKNRPIQFISNSNRLRGPREVNPGGNQKDFYKGLNNEFVRHRNALAGELRSLSSRLADENGRFRGEGYVEVTLSRDAWAKSHRPIDKLFNKARAKLVGSTEIADLVFRVNAESLKEIGATVMRAESEPTKKVDSKTGKVKLKVSETRSETGAIENVVLWSGQQRAVPSVDKAISYLRENGLAACYRVELFDRIGRPVFDEDRRHRDPLVTDFWTRLKRFSQSVGLAVSLLPYKVSQHPTIGVFLLNGEGRFLAKRESEFSFTPDLLGDEPNFDKAAHTKLLHLLSNHPLVKAIELPGVFERSTPPDGFTPSKLGDLPAKIKAPAVGAILKRTGAWSGDQFPLVCVVDGGISTKYNKWVVHRYDGVDDVDHSHGSQIASLLIAGRVMNPELGEFLEKDGCRLIDMALLPASQDAKLYPAGAMSMLDRLDVQLRDLKKVHRVRVVSMSLNVERVVMGKKMSETARRLDEIARKHDVIFVVSAGNANGVDMRDEWAASTTTALQQLAAASGDRLHEPADTLFNVSVAALNGPDVPKAVFKAPARYSRRGSNLRTVKPDFGHFGGAFAKRGALTGLLAMDESADFRYVQGTSFSAPLVAKTLAALDMELNYAASREVLLALLYHSASLHEPLTHKDLISQARQLVGFGLPCSSEAILENKASSFTFVFFENLREGECFRHEFSWPPSLVKSGGKCSGRVRATLVSSPPLVHRYGAEAARVNVAFT